MALVLIIIVCFLQGQTINSISSGKLCHTYSLKLCDLCKVCERLHLTLVEHDHAQWHFKKKSSFLLSVIFLLKVLIGSWI